MPDKQIALLSGAHGFIGSALCKALIEQDYKVASIPREFLSSPADLQGLMEEYEPTIVFHLGAYGNLANQTDSDEIVSANYIKTYLLLKAAEEMDATFVHFSSSSVQLERETFYSATKAGAERLVKAFHEEYGLETLSIRPASVFGEGEPAIHLIPTAIEAIKSGGTLHLEPTSTHSWIYLDDFIDALLLIVKNKKDFLGKAVNISYGKMWSNKQVVDALKEIAGKPLNIELLPKVRTYDTKNWLVTNDELTNLGWEPKIGFKQGLKRTYEHLQQGS